MTPQLKILIEEAISHLLVDDDPVANNIGINLQKYLDSAAENSNIDSTTL